MFTFVQQQFRHKSTESDGQKSHTSIKNVFKIEFPITEIRKIRVHFSKVR